MMYGKTGQGHRGSTVRWLGRVVAVQNLKFFFFNFIHINIVNTNFTALLLLCLQACHTNNLSIFHFI